MRLHYYCFPDDVDAAVRASNGAESTENICEVAPTRYAELERPDKDCLHRDGSRGCVECSHLKVVDAEFEVSGISITRAKELLRQFGGSAYTQHIDRGGGVFEVTPIKLKGNNSRVKYNRHL
ncbi:hypothetical protein FACS1894188_04680 [Clostridia bacterium]|nr:hypothetical protein FACS1894188_04680 [Clostridia bacterium]